MAFFHKIDKIRNAQRKRRERENQQITESGGERESELGGETQTEGTTTERESTS